MRLRILGADDGIAEYCRTNCFLFNKDILIDLGTGLRAFDVDSIAKIDQIFLSRVHMDHIVPLPLVIYTVFASRRSLITSTFWAIIVESCSRIYLIDVIWPNFTRIPSPASSVV